MEEPTEGQWRCLVCGTVWNASDVRVCPRVMNRLCCNDPFCDGTVVRVTLPPVTVPAPQK